MESSINYDVDAIGISAQRYDTLIVFRDEDAFQKIIAANPNMMAVIGADDYTKRNFPGVFIAGIYSGEESKLSRTKALIFAMEAIRQSYESRLQSCGGTCQGSPWEWLTKGNLAD